MKLTANVISGFAASLLVAGGATADIRFYRVDDAGQEFPMWALDAGTPGCHDWLFNRGVHRVAQDGFAWCAVYRAENCGQDSAIPVRWNNERSPVVRFRPGDLWILDEGNVTVSSWRCEERADAVNGDRDYDGGYGDDGRGQSKVTLCHKQKKTITVAEPAVDAHLGHGDRLGPCD